MSDSYIAAIEISSSKIIAAVGKASTGGGLEILAIDQETHTDGIRYGIIQNLEETSLAVSRIFNRLEQRSSVAPRKIKGVIVGLSGRSMRNIPSEVSLTLPDETEIDKDILERLKEQAVNSAIDNSLEVIDAVPRTYKIGKTETLNPKGMVGNSISGVYDLIVCRPEIIKNLKRTISDKLHIDIAGMVVTAMATGHLILSHDEKNLGCMLVDVGAETTTVTIYKNGALRYFSTIPLGGRHITRDIMSLGVIESRAEEIKKTSGNALWDESNSTLDIGGIKLADISNLVAARSEEIIANIIEQISYAGLKESDLSKGIVLIGGTARLQGFAELLSEQSDLQVRQGVLPDYIRFDSHARPSSVESLEIVSVLYAGATLSETECLEMPKLGELPTNGTIPFEEEKPEPEVKKHVEKPRNKFIEGIRGVFSNMFGNPEDDSDLI